jgi:hypothetical protein
MRRRTCRCAGRAKGPGRPAAPSARLGSSLRCGASHHAHAPLTTPPPPPRSCPPARRWPGWWWTRASAPPMWCPSLRAGRCWAACGASTWAARLWATSSKSWSPTGGRCVLAWWWVAGVAGCLRDCCWAAARLSAGGSAAAGTLPQGPAGGALHCWGACCAVLVQLAALQPARLRAPESRPTRALPTTGRPAGPAGWTQPWPLPWPLAPAPCRSLNMMDEPYLMEQVKEQACFVSQDVRADLGMAAKGRRSDHLREFVLPDGVHNLRGYMRVGVAALRHGRLSPWGGLLRARRLMPTDADAGGGFCYVGGWGAVLTALPLLPSWPQEPVRPGQQPAQQQQGGPPSAQQQQQAAGPGQQQPGPRPPQVRAAVSCLPCRQSPGGVAAALAPSFSRPCCLMNASCGSHMATSTWRAPAHRHLPRPCPMSPPRPRSRCCRSTTSASWCQRRSSTQATSGWSRRASPRPLCRWARRRVGACVPSRRVGLGLRGAWRSRQTGAPRCRRRWPHLIGPSACPARPPARRTPRCGAAAAAGPASAPMPDCALAPQAVSSAHAALRPLLYSNVLLAGGSAKCPGFLERVASELRPLVPEEYEVGAPARSSLLAAHRLQRRQRALLGAAGQARSWHRLASEWRGGEGRGGEGPAVERRRLRAPPGPPAGQRGACAAAGPGGLAGGVGLWRQPAVLPGGHHAAAVPGAAARGGQGVLGVTGGGRGEVG